MKTIPVEKCPPSLTLRAATAADLMTPNPVSLPENASVEEAIAFLTDKGFSAAPVIDKAGRAVGVLSRSDILVHDRAKVDYLTPVPDYYGDTDSPRGTQEEGLRVEKSDFVRVGDLMTPVVFSVRPETAACQVVKDMVAWKVHRLFVADSNGVLVGVISALDVLRHLAE